MEFRSYGISVRSKLAVIVLAAVAVVVGGALLALGLALLAGLVVAGALAAGGMTLYRRLRGGRATETASRAELDPADEVFLPPPSERLRDPADRD